MIMDGAAELFMAPTKTKSPLTDPTAFPTVVPNPPIFQHASTAGFRTLWVVFALMLTATIIFGFLSWTVPASKRLFHSLTTTIVLVATLSYFAMATGSGWSWHHVRIREAHDHGIPDTFRHVHRQIYWARYVDWLLTTPLLLVDLSLLAGLSGASIYSVVVADIVMILGGLFAALSHSRKTSWGWYSIAMVAFLWVIYTVLVTGLANAKTKGVKVQRFFTLISSFTLILWVAYPIVWALADGTRHLSVNGEIIAYAVLDVLAKGVFGAWLLFTHRQLPESQVSAGGFWAHGLSSEGTIRVGDDDEGA